jgi:RimJ/RimL family protein N-acetyltransferase
MSFTLREAQPDDAAALLAHIQTVLAEPGIDIPITLEEYDRSVDEERNILQSYLETPNSIFLVAVDETGRIVGEANLRGSRCRALQHAVELGISVRQEWRDRGVGSALIQALIDWARASGIVTRIELRVYARNARAIHVYEKFGFELEGRRRRVIFQEGEYLDDLLMALLLD